MRNDSSMPIRIGRRAFLEGSTLTLAMASLDASPLFAAIENKQPPIKVGMVADLHYADKQSGRTRHYRETLDKLAEAAIQFEKDKLDFIVELGDFIDAADSVDRELKFLERINRDFSTISNRRHYVVGNHCVYTLTKQEFLDGVEQERAYYSFDAGAYHFVVLDACFRGDGEPYGRKNNDWKDTIIPPSEIAWLKADLEATPNKTIVFVHQRLDVSNQYGVNNCVEIRKILEDSGKVAAVFQGHSHKNDYNEIDGIHYCTLVAMVEGSGAANNGYATMSLDRQGAIRISGFRKQSDYTWTN